MPINISQIEKANAQHKLPISNASGELEFSSISTADFSISGNVIRTLPMAYSDVVAGSGPLVAPSSPPSPASGLGDNVLYIRKYDDMVRVWMKTAGTWAHVFDLT